jgi:hypothetical protein
VSALPGALAPFVSAMSAYDIGPLGGVHRGLPSSTVSITIPEAEHLEIGWPGRPGARQRLRAVVAGLHLDAAEIRQEGRARGVWLTLSPLGARVGVTAKEFQRLVRFEVSRRRMAAPGPVSLAEVAATSGFADQARCPEPAYDRPPHETLQFIADMAK